MKLFEIFDQHKITDPVAHGRHVIRRLEQTGGDNDENADKMDTLRDAVDELEIATMQPHNHNHAVNGGSVTKMQTLQRAVLSAIQDFEDDITSPTGRGGSMKDRRAVLNQKQMSNPLAQRIRHMRKTLKDGAGFDSIKESASKGSTGGDKIAR